MSIPRTLLLTLLSATTTIGLLTIGAPQVASASTTPPAAQATSNRAGYTSTPWSEASPTEAAPTEAAPTAVSPSGCMQYADYPHRSTSADGRVNGKVRAVCQVTVPKISHSAQLWETRWWGWDRIGINQPFSAAWASFGRAMANDWCRNNTVRVTGNGYVIDRDSRTYYAATVSVSVKNPCTL